MGTSSPDSGGANNFQALNGGHELVEATLMFHYGAKGIDTESGTIGRSDIVDIRTATGSPSAFDAAVAASSAGAWYSALRTAATQAGITGDERPEPQLRAYVAAKWADY